MDTTLVLVADAHRARCFERHATSHALTELAEFVHPSLSLGGRASGSDLTGAAGKGHGSTGHAGTQFEPHTEAHAKGRDEFARQLADYINQAVPSQHCNELILIATQPMLGALKPCLNVAANKVLQRCIPSDLTHYQGPELKQRIDKALQLPD